MTKKVLVPIADGTEELEAIAIIDILRRANAEVTVASVMQTTAIQASQGTKIIADTLITECNNHVYDLIALPGGMPGVEHLRDCPILINMLKKQREDNRLYAAICASPLVVLHHHGLLDGIEATYHPSWLPDSKDTASERVVVDQNCITSQGPGTAVEFALKLVEILYDKEKMKQISKSMLVVI